MPLTSVLFSFGISLSLFSIFAGNLSLWDSNGISLIPSGSVGLIYGLFLTAIGFGLNQFRISGLKLIPEISAFGLLLVFFSDWLTKSYNLLQGPSIRGEILLLGFISYFAIRSKFRFFWWAVAIMAVVILVLSFIDFSDGRLLFSDDHSVVLYRLQLLRENFPAIPFYNPLWNAGLDARDFFATGILNVYLIFLPLFYLFDPINIYNYIVLAIIFLLVPGSAYIGARIEGLKNPGPIIASVLSLSVNLFWYRWCLKYGSMGFVTSVALIPINVALISRFIDPEGRFDGKLALFAAFTLSLMLLWSPTAFIFLPIVALCFFQLRRLIRSAPHRNLILALLVLNLPWMLVFISASNVDQFISVKGKNANEIQQVSDEQDPGFTHRVVKGGQSRLSFRSVLDDSQEWAKASNPALLFLGIPGLLLLGRKRSRITYSLTAAWLGVMGLLITPLKPQLEFDRMLLVVNFVLCVPAANLFSLLLDRGANAKPFSRASSAIVSGYILAGIFAVGAIIYNRTPEIYYFSDSVPNALADSIKANGGDGRVVFAGFVLHELSNGHLAPLIKRAEHPLVASTPFHNVWWYTELIPKEYLLKGPDGYEEYFDLMNASAVVAHDKNWRDYFIQRPDRYRFVDRNGVFNLFQRISDHPGYFFEGSGSIVSQSTHSVTVKVDSASAVLKFNYFPFLRSSGCVLSGREFPGGIKLIELTNCTPGDQIIIESQSAFSRAYHRLMER